VAGVGNFSQLQQFEFGGAPLNELHQNGESSPKPTILVNQDFVDLECFANYSWSGAIFVKSGAGESLPSSPLGQSQWEISSRCFQHVTALVTRNETDSRSAHFHLTIS
jgi:hypothetical protein